MREDAAVPSEERDVEEEEREELGVEVGVEDTREPGEHGDMATGVAEAEADERCIAPGAAAMGIDEDDDDDDDGKAEYEDGIAAPDAPPEVAGG